MIYSALEKQRGFVCNQIMSIARQPLISDGVVYPESDGKPIAENTIQFRWIQTIYTGIESLFRQHSNVFVAADLFWYPVEGDNRTVQAPDVMVAFGRPKGDRGSYRQWEEDGIAPQVVFEVLTPSNRPAEMARKLLFYEEYGVEEYYIFDPDHSKLQGYRREGDNFREIPQMDGWVSPRLGIRFDFSTPELIIYRPDGQRFLTLNEMLDRMNEEQKRADEERLARLQAQQRAHDEQKRREEAESKAQLLAAKLRELGIDVP
jgi:Uma2 family endonuclease